LRYELAPFILALVLGPMFEQALRQSLIISRGDPSIFFTRPISAGLLVLAVGSLAWVLRGRSKTNAKRSASG
jgi:TctA family transporter